MSEKILLAIEAMSQLDEMAAAAEKHGYRLRVLAEDSGYYGATNTEIIEFPTRDHDQLITYVKENLSEISQVFSVTDTWGIIASKIRDMFGFQQFVDTAKLEFFRDKEAVQDELIKHGFARPSQRWPKILKLRTGTGKIGVHLVESESDISAVIENSGRSRTQFVTQDFYLGPAYSAELWRDSETELFFGVTNRIISDPPFFTEHVKSFPWAANSEWEIRVRDWVFELLETLDYNLGLAHIEFIETATGFELVEINPRMAGAMISPGILKTTNFNPYSMVINQALGLPPCKTTARKVHGGYSHVSLYATSTGTITSIAGLANIAHYPGQPEWIPSRTVGDQIVEVGTYRSRIGNLVATGDTASLAQDRAICVSQAITPKISAD